MTFIAPANDFFFRYLFGKTGHESLTLDFVNAVLADLGLGPLLSLVIQNPFNPKESVEDKESVLDIKARDEDGRIYNIEMQLQGNDRFVNRSLYYWAKCYAAQLNEGDDYQLLMPVICINLVNFPMNNATRRVHNCFLLKEHRAPDAVLTDHLMIHFLHLTEYEKAAYSGSEPLNQWLRYFCAREDDMKGLETVLNENPAIKKARELHRQFTADDLLVEQYEARQKYLRDVATIRNVSFAEGREKGLADGRSEGKLMESERKDRFVVHHMHRKGLSPETISEYTNISLSRIHQILTEPPPASD